MGGFKLGALARQEWRAPPQTLFRLLRYQWLNENEYEQSRNAHTGRDRHSAEIAVEVPSANTIGKDIAAEIVETKWFSQNANMVRIRDIAKCAVALRSVSITESDSLVKTVGAPGFVNITNAG